MWFSYKASEQATAALEHIAVLSAKATTDAAKFPVEAAEKQEKDPATVAAEFEKRQVEAIKARILCHARPAKPEPTEGGLEVEPIKREKVIEMLQARPARPMVVIAPEVRLLLQHFL